MALFSANYSDPWSYWADITPTSSTMGAACLASAWTIWTTNSTADNWGATSSRVTITNSSSSVWVNWVDRVRGIDIHVPRRSMSDEERAQYEERIAQERERRRADQERYAAERAVLLKAKQVAEAKAERLLLENLNERQRNEYVKDRRFHVHLKNGRVYRIKYGRHGNVERVVRQPNGQMRRVENLCVHPRVECPNQDTMLAQKLILEANENTLREVANITAYH